MYNNPYVMNAGLRGASTLGKAGGLFSSVRAINWGTLLGNTQKTLGIINQAIPIVYQVKPIVNNAKTMFRVMGAVNGNKADSYSESNVMPEQKQDAEKTSSNQPMFFI